MISYFCNTNDEFHLKLLFSDVMFQMHSIFFSWIFIIWKDQGHYSATRYLDYYDSLLYTEHAFTELIRVFTFFLFTIPNNESTKAEKGYCSSCFHIFYARCFFVVSYGDIKEYFIEELTYNWPEISEYKSFFFFGMLSIPDISFWNIGQTSTALMVSVDG